MIMMNEVNLNQAHIMHEYDNQDDIRWVGEQFNNVNRALTGNSQILDMILQEKMVDPSMRMSVATVNLDPRNGFVKTRADSTTKVQLQISPSVDDEVPLSGIGRRCRPALSGIAP